MYRGSVFLEAYVEQALDHELDLIVQQNFLRYKMTDFRHRA
jgi:hypothetical protein